MRICVYGAGAVGGHIAGRLADGGADVSVIARGETLAAIRQHGLRVQTRDRMLTSRPQATDRPEDLPSIPPVPQRQAAPAGNGAATPARPAGPPAPRDPPAPSQAEDTVFYR